MRIYVDAPGASGFKLRGDHYQRGPVQLVSAVPLEDLTGRVVEASVEHSGQQTRIALKGPTAGTIDRYLGAIVREAEQA